MTVLETLQAEREDAAKKLETIKAKIKAETEEMMINIFQGEADKLEESIKALDKNIESTKASDALNNKDWEEEYKKFPALKVIHADTMDMGGKVSFTDNKRANVTLKMAKKNQIKSILLQGPSGTGKTTMIRWIGALLNRPVISVDASGNLSEDDFLGKWNVGKTGTPVFIEGPLLMAMRTGSILVVEEINSTKPSIMTKLNSLLDDLNQVSSPKDGEIIKAQPGFMFAGTYNKGYAGTRPLNKAFINRFNIALEINQITEAKHKAILKAKLPDASENYINIAWQILESTENLIELSEHDAVISVRQSENIIKIKMAEDDIAKEEGRKPGFSWTNAIKMGMLNQTSGFDEDVQADIKKVAQHIADNLDKRTGIIDPSAVSLGSVAKSMKGGAK